MRTQKFIIVASHDAYVDPSVQVHDAGCSHGLTRWYSAKWDAFGPFGSATVANYHAECIASAYSVAEAMWCDCALMPAGTPPWPGGAS